MRALASRVVGRIALSMLLLLAVQGAHAAADCTAEQLELAVTPAQARELSVLCADTPSIRFGALDKLNQMALPSGIPRFVPQTIGNEPIEKVTYAANIFFQLDQAYPDELAMPRLAEMVQKISGGGVLDVVIISSSENAFEQGATRDVAQLRTEFVRRYFEAAGIDPRHIYGRVQKAEHASEDTPEANARDRCARIEIVMHRKKVSP